MSKGKAGDGEWFAFPSLGGLDSRYIFLYITVMDKTTKRTERLGEAPAICRGRVWLEGAEGTFLGYGRIVLLERISELGSISRAARSMEMSYKHAWDLVESMNRQGGEPLVVKVSGGKGGGGATLTGRGQRAVAAFRALETRFRAYLDGEGQRFAKEFNLNDRP